MRLAYNIGACDDILGFIIRAGVSVFGSSVSFRNLAAQFFRSPSDTSPQLVQMDDISASTSGNTLDAEAIVEAPPDGSGFCKARVFAQVRIQSPDLPAPTDLFGQVFVFTS